MGADWAIRVQYFVLAVLVAAIMVFMAGLFTHFSPGNFEANLRPAYGTGYTFWAIFAIYFPAVTGINAGINMSGDLKDPGRSIPAGTLAAIGVSAVVYGLQILLSGGAQTKEQLIERPFDMLVEQSPNGFGFLVIAGVFAASLSSDIGSFVGASRILQAVGRDRVFPKLRYFWVGAAHGDEPRRALALVAVATIGVLLYCGNDASGDPLNAVASVITMFFLYTYGMANLAAFVEAFTGNPSFRPRFRFFHYNSGLLGAVGCLAAAALINSVTAFVVVSLLATLYASVRKRELSAAYGDARRGFYFIRVRGLLFKLVQMPRHPKNWRPTCIVLSGNPNTRRTLAKYAVWLESGAGIVVLVEVLHGEFENVARRRATALRRLEEFIRSEDMEAFPDVIAGEDFDQVLPVLLQSHSLGPLKPNLVLLGWPDDGLRAEAFASHLKIALELNMSLVVLRDEGLPVDGEDRRIDIWWRGRENGSLMIILAHLLSRSPGWEGARIRILRCVESSRGRDPATQALRELVDAARVEADIEIVVSPDPFPGLLRRHSSDATCVFPGFQRDALSDPPGIHGRYTKLFQGLPTVLLVCSSGEADLLE